jgi:hypothetical protein
MTQIAGTLAFRLYAVKTVRSHIVSEDLIIWLRYDGPKIKKNKLYDYFISKSSDLHWMVKSILTAWLHAILSTCNPNPMECYYDLRKKIDNILDY